MRCVLRVRTKAGGAGFRHARELQLGLSVDAPLKALMKFKTITRVGALLAAALLFCSPPVRAKEPNVQGAGFVTEFAASYDDALQALQEIVQDQTIRGTYMSDREKTLTGAATADSTPLFPHWQGEGKIFYKIRTEAIAPRHFLESADIGTVAVRYVLTNVSPERTRLRI